MVHTVRWMVARENDDKWRFKTESQVFGWFLIGGLLGGVISGAFVALLAVLLAPLGKPMRATLVLGAALVATLYALRSAGLIRIPAPQSRHQVPPAWRSIFSPRFASLIYSTALGLSFFTRVPSLVFYPLLLAALSLGESPLIVVAAFGLLGFTRAATGVIVPAKNWYLTPMEEISSTLGRGWHQMQRTELVVLVGVAILLIPTGLAIQ